MKKRILITGIGGFIGHHLAKYLKTKGNDVYGVDLVRSKYIQSYIKSGIPTFIGDLTDPLICMNVTKKMDEVYNLAALNGSIEFTTNNKAELVHNNALINLNMAEACHKSKVKKVFFASSACVYPMHYQTDKKVHYLTENDAYPANCDTEYGWEKLFSERVYQSYAKDYGMNIRIARFINIYGPECFIDTLKSKAPMALTKKVIEAGDRGDVAIWGDGEQVRTFLYIDDLLDGIDKLMNSDVTEPINLGSDKAYTINQLVDIIAHVERIHVDKVHQLDKVQGVRVRIPDLRKAHALLGWKEKTDIIDGLKKVNEFVHSQL